MGYSHNQGYSATNNGYAVGKKGSEVQVIDSNGNITVPASKALSLATGQFVKGERFTINYPNFAAADVAKVFFVAPAACKVINAYEVHGTASAAATNLNVEKLTSGQAVGSGAAVLASAINMTASAMVPQSVSALTTAAATLAAGNALALLSASGAATSLANASLTITAEWA